MLCKRKYFFVYVQIINLLISWLFDITRYKDKSGM